ncbi:hypothetical protein ACN08N_27185 (plasmid) [Photobacterium leiognathi subsp. mandapamensis]
MITMLIRTYLRASTAEQYANCAKDELRTFKFCFWGYKTKSN